MNIRSIRQVLLSCSLLLLLGSCSLEGLAPSDTATVLSLSHTEVALDESGRGTTSISVRTNAYTWETMTNVAWLTTKIEGDELVLQAEPNSTNSHRQAIVSIVAGGQVATIAVAQSRGGVLLQLGSDELQVTHRGGTHLVALRHGATPLPIVEIEDGKEWVTVEPFASFLSITLQPNESYEPRSAKVFLRLADKVEEIVVEQGAMGVGFQIPLLELYHTGHHQVVSYEQGKYGNVLRNFTIGGRYTNDSYFFVCNSPLFSYLEYNYHHLSGLFFSAKYTGTGIADVLAGDKFKQFLVSEGFEIVGEQEEAERHTITAERVVDKGIFIATVTPRSATLGDTSTFEVTFVEGEPMQYPTFSSFPYDKIEYLNNPDYNSDAIKSAEMTEGNTIVLEEANANFPAYVQKLAFSVAEQNRPVTRREFNFNRGQKNSNGADLLPNGEMEQMRVHFDRIELAYWLNTYGQYVMTKQFGELLDKEGFVYYAQSNNMPYFYNANRKLMIVPRVEFDLNGNSYLAINYYKIDIKMSSNSHSATPATYSFGLFK